MIDYKGFTIRPTSFRVSPFYIDGEFVRFGYNVCSSDGWINVMPGATWFRTIEDAKEGVDDLIAAGGMAHRPYETIGTAQRFWKLVGQRLDAKDRRDLGDLNKVWHELAAAGVCGNSGGADHERVKSEWVRSRKPVDIEAFIRRRANIGPDDDEIWIWEDM